ncbi:putative LRR receptor-like serine/threonine-protein kinase [Prunus yedoensis var. nudiflora]|uniref:Putative LRR receptor-like serine/threonine-protein kinase n=1 Tax=Prunus yedoensis var. nudiflora TaxID=2094558 RepID=A0A314U955_PRUYE|nr:putative LRR receptor-like serine/threonine-protein kinase [Prunus yedoensis var. nudiflora]
MLANGDINSIVDPRLEGNFNTNSVWKAVEIAMACVSVNAIKRPSMSQVVVDLIDPIGNRCPHHRHFKPLINMSIKWSTSNSPNINRPNISAHITAASPAVTASSCDEMQLPFFDHDL